MEKKMTYTRPELDVIGFSALDIVTASDVGGNGFDGETDNDW